MIKTASPSLFLRGTQINIRRFAAAADSKILLSYEDLAAVPQSPIKSSASLPLFNTHKLVSSLERAGLTQTQSVAIMDALITVSCILFLDCSLI
jgi:hypothetical protein